MITPNQGEFEAVAGECSGDEELAERGWRMVEGLELDALLVTRSEKGMMLLESGNEPLFLSTQAREVFDVTGAGDTVIATLAGALKSGASFGVHALVGEIRASRDTDFGILNAEAALTNHRAGQLLAGHDTFIDVLVERMGVGFRSQFVGEDFARRNAALKKLQGGIHLCEVLRSF